MNEPKRCTALTARGQPCRLQALPGSDPPLCPLHDRRRSPSGARDLPRLDQQAPSSNRRAPKPGIDGQIEDLDRRIHQLGAYIDERRDDLEPGEWLKLLDLHSTLIGRVTRVRQARQRMGGDDDTTLTRAIHKALDAMSRQLGMTL